MAERHGVSCVRPRAASRVVVLKSPVSRRPYADSRVQLTGAVGRTAVGVAASCRPEPPQCRGWRRSARDGVVVVMEETRLTGPTSRHCPGRAWNGRPSPFRGLLHPLSRVRRPVRTRVGSIVSRS
jgi:hypothetical protein